MPEGNKEVICLVLLSSNWIYTMYTVAALRHLCLTAYKVVVYVEVCAEGAEYALEFSSACFFFFFVMICFHAIREKTLF